MLEPLGRRSGHDRAGVHIVDTAVTRAINTVILRLKRDGTAEVATNGIEGGIVSSS